MSFLDDVPTSTPERSTIGKKHTRVNSEIPKARATRPEDEERKALREFIAKKTIQTHHQIAALPLSVKAKEEAAIQMISPRPLAPPSSQSAPSPQQLRHSPSPPPQQRHPAKMAKLACREEEVKTELTNEDVIDAALEFLGGPRCVISTVGQCMAAVSLLRGRHETVLAIDCEGVNLSRTGRLCLLQMATTPPPPPGPLLASWKAAGRIQTPQLVFLFDIVVGGRAIFDAGLREILEDPSIIKVLHDTRGDSDALLHQFQVRLTNVFDTQIAYACLQTQEGQGVPLPASLNTVLKRYARGSENEYKERVRAAMEADPQYWVKRPLSDDACEYASQDVIQLPAARIAIEYVLRPASRKVFVEYCARYLEMYRSVPDDQIDAVRAASFQDGLPRYGFPDWDQEASRRRRPFRPAATPRPPSESSVPKPAPKPSGVPFVRAPTPPPKSTTAAADSKDNSQSESESEEEEPSAAPPTSSGTKQPHPPPPRAQPPTSRRAAAVLGATCNHFRKDATPTGASVSASPSKSPAPSYPAYDQYYRERYPDPVETVPAPEYRPLGGRTVSPTPLPWAPEPTPREQRTATASPPPCPVPADPAPLQPYGADPYQQPSAVFLPSAPQRYPSVPAEVDQVGIPLLSTESLAALSSEQMTRLLDALAPRAPTPPQFR
ncbi:putative 3'-5' exonuclease [Paratrimastix pyriformis]|uniref:3'-5' exonuclease n=1 Tax=Paratrimastix pyriformis TaxID=342808 RepID=A0ABQ8UII9_9EUKA|nr:putative 3'-5' exonuclease [Paratrimastix pyriformis]